MIAQMPDKREIYYQTKGLGPDLLLVHGGLPEYFESMVEVLSPRYRCTSFDRLGFRRSIHPARNSTLDEQVAAIEAVHSSVTTEPAWVFGHSSGGNFALAYAVSYPDRVKGLLLVEPALYAIYPTEETPPDVERLRKVVVPLFDQSQAEQGWSEFLETVFAGQNKAAGRPRLSKEELENIRSFGFDLQKAIAWYPSPENLRRLSQPVLLMEGDQSPLLLRDISRRLNSQLPNSKFITAAGQSHGMPLSAPKWVAEQFMAFMSEHESAGSRNK